MLEERGPPHRRGSLAIELEGAGENDAGFEGDRGGVARGRESRWSSVSASLVRRERSSWVEEGQLREKTLLSGVNASAMLLGHWWWSRVAVTPGPPFLLPPFPRSVIIV
ncbi:hypothetical protein AHAS_Ahas13G0297400 [Arachis hypogaea]